MRIFSVIAGLFLVLVLLLLGRMLLPAPTLSAPALPAPTVPDPTPPPPTVAQPAPAPALAKPPSLVRDGRVAAPALAQLARFHKRLADLRAGRTRRVTILQIGDSHTQAEHFSGRLRTLFQARFGSGGRGMLPPGSPYDYWRPYQVRAQQTGACPPRRRRRGSRSAPPTGTG